MPTTGKSRRLREAGRRGNARWRGAEAAASIRARRRRLAIFSLVPAIVPRTRLQEATTLAHAVVRRHPPTARLLGIVEIMAASAIPEHTLGTFRGCRSNYNEPYKWATREEAMP